MMNRNIDLHEAVISSDKFLQFPRQNLLLITRPVYVLAHILMEV
jgi:hypothetical protein